MSQLKQEQIDEIEKQLIKPKTRKGQKIVKDRAPKIVEGPKSTLFVKGNKSSETISTFMKEIYNLKRDHSTNYTKKHDIHPFEEIQQVEKFCGRSESTLFVFGSHQKKRPNNIVFGRLFKEVLLDMVEVGIENFKSTDEFKHLQGVIHAHSRPNVIFQGEVFETIPTMMKFKSLFLDLFIENVAVENIDLMTGLSHSVVVSATEERIYLNVYAIQIDTKIAKKANVSEDEKPLKVVEVGPSCEFVVRREKWATIEEFKTACKRQKVVVKKENKNVSRNNIGDKVARVFTDKQNLHSLALHKRKKIVKSDKLQEKRDKINKQTEATTVDV